VKLASGLMAILHGEFRRKVVNMDSALQQAGQLIAGRQIAWLIYRHFQLGETEGMFVDIQSLFALTLQGDNLAAYLNDWEMILSSVKTIPPDEYLESLMATQLRKSISLGPTIALYDQGINHEGKPRSYTTLKTMLTRHLEMRRQTKLREERETKGGGRRFATASFPNPKAKSKQGDCRQFLKTGQCSRGDSCPWTHSTDKAAARKGRPFSSDSAKGKGKGKGKSRSPSPKSKGDGKGGKPKRGTSPSGEKDRPLCRFYAKGTCTKGKECSYWHPSAKKHRSPSPAAKKSSSSEQGNAAKESSKGSSKKEKAKPVLPLNQEGSSPA
jgi:hypothetical protein